MEQILSKCDTLALVRFPEHSNDYFNSIWCVTTQQDIGLRRAKVKHKNEMRNSKERKNERTNEPTMKSSWEKECTYVEL